MKKRQQYQVWILPWAGILQELKVGSVTMWPWSQTRVKDEKIAHHLSRWFPRFVDPEGHPVGTVSVCQHGHLDFRQLAPEEVTDMRNAVDCLLFSEIHSRTEGRVEANNRTIAPPPADLFELLRLSFTPGEQSVSVRCGRTLDTGYTIDEIFYTIPRAALGSVSAFETTVLRGLDNLLMRKSLRSFRRRVMRSLEWFRLAHTEADNVSEMSKVVMMGTAFETLLKFPQGRKQKYFADTVGSMLSGSRFRRSTRTTYKSKKKVPMPRPAAWAWDFYDLRSRVVHGDQVEPKRLGYKDWVTQLIVADIVFGHCLTRLLYEKHILGQDERKAAANLRKKLPQFFKSDSEAVKFCSSWRFDCVYRALDWLKPESKRGKQP